MHDRVFEEIIRHFTSIVSSKLKYLAEAVMHFAHVFLFWVTYITMSRERERARGARVDTTCLGKVFREDSHTCILYIYTLTHTSNFCEIIHARGRRLLYIYICIDLDRPRDDGQLKWLSLIQGENIRCVRGKSLGAICMAMKLCEWRYIYVLFDAFISMRTYISAYMGLCAWFIGH